MPQKAGNERGMDLHAEYCDLTTYNCRLELPSLRIIMALLASKLHRGIILSHTDSGRPSDALPALLTPVTKPPCSRYDTGRQLLAIHFIIIHALSKSVYAPQLVLATTTEDWFKTFLPVSNNVDNPASILDDINLEDYKPQPMASNKRPMDSSTATASNSKRIKVDREQSMDFE